MPRRNKATTLAQVVNQKWRSGSERLRRAFGLARTLRHPVQSALVRRVTRSVTADPIVAVHPDVGFRLFPPGSFPEADEVATLAARLLSDAGGDPTRTRKGSGRKKFLVNVLDPGTLDASHPAVRLALRPDLLSATVAYMGTVPVLRSIQVFYSGTLEDEPVSSQLYHCDADDVRQMKIFVLCSDIGSDNGPLTVLDAARSARVRRSRGYRFNDRLTDQQVDEVLGGPARPVEIVGPPGTVCLVDTSRCFHFGSRVRPGAAPRLVTMIQYLSQHAFVLPGDYQSGAAVTWRGDAELTPLQRTVLTGDYRHLASDAPTPEAV